jgi:hypothetical protein
MVKASIPGKLQLRQLALYFSPEMATKRSFGSSMKQQEVQQLGKPHSRQPQQRLWKAFVRRHLKEDWERWDSFPA